MLACAVLGAALLSGYILTLDMVFTPKVHVALNPLVAGNGTFRNLTLSTLNLILPGDVIEKLILLAIFTLAGLGMHRLVVGAKCAKVANGAGKSDGAGDGAPQRSLWAGYAAGVLYVVNPFTYGRLMAGQYLVLAGYALMPWLVAALVRFVRRPEPATAWRLAAWTAAIGFVSLHYIGFAALAAVVAVALGAWRARRRPEELKRLALWSGGVALAVLVVNSFWLVPLALHRSAQAALISGFDDRYFLSFRTIGDHTFGQVLNTMALYGFWGDDQGWYTLPKAVFGWWWVVAAVLLGLAGLGAWKGWRSARGDSDVRLTVALVLVLGAVGLVLAQGIMGSPFAGLNSWLVQHVWLYRGYREPGKFIGLMALGLAYLVGLGADWLLGRARAAQFNTDWLPGLLVALPLIYTPTMLWGAGGQLRAVQYPADWYALNRRLDAEHGGGKVLFLPWHQYLKFPFTGRIIANPAPAFFDRPTVAGDNAEIGLIERQSTNPQSAFIEQQILAAGRTDVAAKLRSRGFEYVVLAQTAFDRDYIWLNSVPGLKLVSRTQSLRVYKVD